MTYDTVIYCFNSAKKGIDFGKSLFVLEGIVTVRINYGIVLPTKAHSIRKVFVTYYLMIFD